MKHMRVEWFFQYFVLIHISNVCETFSSMNENVTILLLQNHFLDRHIAFVNLSIANVIGSFGWDKKYNTNLQITLDSPTTWNWKGHLSIMLQGETNETLWMCQNNSLPCYKEVNQWVGILDHLQYNTSIFFYF